MVALATRSGSGSRIHGRHIRRVRRGHVAAVATSNIRAVFLYPARHRLPHRFREKPALIEGARALLLLHLHLVICSMRSRSTRARLHLLRSSPTVETSPQLQQCAPATLLLFLRHVLGPPSFVLRRPLLLWLRTQEVPLAPVPHLHPVVVAAAFGGVAERALLCALFPVRHAGGPRRNPESAEQGHHEHGLPGAAGPRDAIRVCTVQEIKHVVVIDAVVSGGDEYDRP
mmetsp:Transcript_27820/g.70283  ORF Transcript_27820/g.70283 Transcript_27820/m.70283 type:complete len:228 (-) Transcript_27820:968-1651(-)